jgi:hypothetical protein
MQLYITFGDLATEALRKGFEQIEDFNTEIVTIKDSLYVGPLTHINEDLGRANRLHWWKDIFMFFNIEDNTQEVALHDYNVVEKIKTHCSDEAYENTCTIWMGQNANDVCAYFWLINQLQEFQGRIQVIYLNMLPFINEKGNIFYPTHLSQIQASEFVKALKVERKVALHEFEVDKDEWKLIYEHEDTYRILDGGKKIITKKENLFDTDILKLFSADGIKVSKLLNTLLGKLPYFPSDMFLLSRVKYLVEQGVIHIIKQPKNYRDIELSTHPKA